MSEKVRVFSKVLAVVVVLGLVWRFVIWPRTDRYETWEGTLIDVYKEYDGSKEGADPHQAEWFPYRYYWKVKRPEGEEMTVEVPYKVWLTGRHMKLVVKERGQLHPRVVDESVPDTADPPNPGDGPVSPSPEADLPTPVNAGEQGG